MFSFNKASDVYFAVILIIYKYLKLLHSVFGSSLQILEFRFTTTPII